MSKRAGGAGARKHGRNDKKCARYRAEGRREKNRYRRMKRIARNLAKAAA